MSRNKKHIMDLGTETLILTAVILTIGYIIVSQVKEAVIASGSTSVRVDEPIPILPILIMIVIIIPFIIISYLVRWNKIDGIKKYLRQTYRKRSIKNWQEVKAILKNVWDLRFRF